MIDGFSPALEPPEDPSPRACRQIARALAAEGCTVAELAYMLDTDPMTAWWLSDFTAENDSGAPPQVIAARIAALAGDAAA